MKYLIYFTGILLWTTAIQAAAPADTLTWNLTQCIEYAQQNNITIQDAELNKTKAEAGLVQSKMNRLPGLSASVSQNFTHKSSFENSTSLGISSQVTLFNGFQLYNQVKQNELTVDQNQMLIDEARNNITLSLMEAYIQALYYSENITTAKATLESSEKELEVARAKYERGMMALKEVTEVESAWANNKYSLIKAQNDYEKQVLIIKQLLELEPETPFQITTPASEMAINTELPVLSSVYEAALSIMPEVQSGIQQVSIDSLSLAMARGGYLPSLSLSASIGSGYQSTAIGDFATQVNDGWNESVGLTLSIPLFSNYQNKTQVQYSKINIEKSKLSLTSTHKELYSKIENIWKNALAYQTEIEAAQTALKAAEQAYELTREQFNLGAASSSDLVLSQSKYISASQSYIQTKYMTVYCKQLLDFYQGKELTL